jgi:FkbM family methyltransferase
VKRFLAKPAAQKLDSLTFRLRPFLPQKPETLVLPFGATWLLEQSALDQSLRAGQFENAEIRFVQRLLEPGMTVLDAGAHHGLYTLLASVRVGPKGRVFAFEPSPRERERLRRHIRLNKCSNVRIEQFALGTTFGKSDFFLVEGIGDYCNSLRRPAVKAETKTIQVEVTSLDGFLSREPALDVDFMKVDTEGAELDVLKGAVHFLQAVPRAVILIEVAEIRTAPWGYSAREIIRFLSSFDYDWFEIQPTGTLTRLREDLELLDTNLVAVPREKTQSVIRALETK